MTTKEDLQERAQLVRIHEANCKIEYPTRDEANFRLAIMKRIGLQFALKEVRSASIDGPPLNQSSPPPIRRAARSAGADIAPYSPPLLPRGTRLGRPFFAGDPPTLSSQ